MRGRLCDLQGPAGVSLQCSGLLPETTSACYTRRTTVFLVIQVLAAPRRAPALSYGTYLSSRRLRTSTLSAAAWCLDTHLLEDGLQLPL